jgi:hypothetical protein
MTSNAGIVLAAHLCLPAKFAIRVTVDVYIAGSMAVGNEHCRCRSEGVLY